MFDLIIQNGTVIDGTGSAPYCADIGIRAGKIVQIAPGLTGAQSVIDAAGLTVTPGFIDSHSHSDKTFLSVPLQAEKTEQGITTSIAGQCGGSPAPRRDPETGEFHTMGKFLDQAEAVPQGSNAVTFLGHATLRKAVVGAENRLPTAKEMDTMKGLLAEAVDSGALGITFGLTYAPSCFAETQELIELATVAREHGGMIAAHLRNENDKALEAVKEFIHILRCSGAKGIHSHHKVTQKRNWGNVEKTLALHDQAVAEGIDIYSDAYPYIASSTTLTPCFLTKDLLSGGSEAVTKALADPAVRQAQRAYNLSRWGDDLSWVMVTKCKGHPEYAGLTLPQIAQLRNQEVYEALFDIIAECGSATSACFFSMREEDVCRVLAHPRTMICTDSGVATGSTLYHPRMRGSFPRVLGRYVRERKIVSLPEMIRKMTSLPAQVYGLPTKGLLKPGYDADICIFNPDTIIDHADYTHCTARCDGLAYVLVDGQIVAKDGVATGLCPGKVLRRQN